MFEIATEIEAGIIENCHFVTDGDKIRLINNNKDDNTNGSVE